MYAIFFILLASGMIVGGVYAIRNRQPRIVMDHKGILIAGCFDAKIPWPCIRSVDLVGVPRAGSFLSLVVSSSCVDVDRINRFKLLVKLNKDESTVTIGVTVQGADMKPDEIVRLIRSQISPMS